MEYGNWIIHNGHICRLHNVHYQVWFMIIMIKHLKC